MSYYVDHVLLEGSKPRPSLIGESTDPRLGIYERHSDRCSIVIVAGISRHELPYSALVF